MFFKKDDNGIVSAEHVETPSAILSEGTKDEHTYPVDGWYSFASLDDAIAFYAGKKDTNSISPRQVRLELTAIGLRQSVESYVAASSQDVKDWWEFSSSIERTSPLLITAATTLGLSSKQLDQFFINAGKL
jgi:hypothetical protein